MEEGRNKHDHLPVQGMNKALIVGHTSIWSSIMDNLMVHMHVENGTPFQSQNFIQNQDFINVTV